MKISELKVSRGRPFGVAFEGELTIAPSSLIGVYGPNGSGKTSLMKGLAGLLPPSQRSGYVFIGTEMIDLSTVGSEWVRNILYLGSEFQTPFHLTLRELFEMAAAVSKGGIHLELGSAERTRIALVIEAMGLVDELNHSIQEMSDGERQWAMIARGLIQRPRLLLLDETCSKLDLDRLVQLQTLLRGPLAGEMSIWVAAHDLNFLARLCGSILLFQKGGPVELQPGGPQNVRALIEKVYPGIQPDSAIF